ncbi:MAG: molecular chaperone TorD family protein [Burkholderiales bacterium]
MNAEALPDTVAAEDQVRGDFYALLARLFYTAPDAPLLAAIASADELVPEGNSALAESWKSLVAAASVADDELARVEYDAVFVGVGKAQVTPYASAYLVATGREKVLAELRGTLARLGLGRAGGAHEPEDHFAALCDVMRHLILAGGSADEREFFDRYLRRAYPGLCEALLACADANFYKHVARFARAVFDLESQAFEMV